MPPEEVTEPVETTEPVAETVTEPEVEAETAQSDDGFTPEDLANAKNIYRQLQDPNSAKQFIQGMARLAGFEVNEQQTPKQQRASLKETLAQSLGPEFKFLADRLGDSLEPAINAYIKEQMQPVQAQFEQAQKEAISQQIDAELANLEKSTAGRSKKLEAKMTKLMDEFPLPKGVPISKYLKHIYTLADADAIQGDALKSKVRQSTPSTSRTPSGGVNTDRVKLSSKNATIRDAVLAASRGEKWED